VRVDLSATVRETANRKERSVPIRSRLALLLAFAAAPLGLSTAAGAANLTGTWEGSYSCQGFDGENYKTGNKDSVLLISQEGQIFAANIDNDTFVYNGLVIDDDADPAGKGNLVMNQCGTDAIPGEGPEGEIVRMAIKVNADKGTGTLKGVSIVEFFDKTGPGVVTCKLKYKRVSTTVAKFNGCPA
jgi:hypothetical protein